GRARPAPRAVLGGGTSPEVERRAVRRAHRARARPLSVTDRSRRALAVLGTSAALVLAGVAASVSAAPEPPACPGCALRGAPPMPPGVPGGTTLTGDGGLT